MENPLELYNYGWGINHLGIEGIQLSLVIILYVSSILYLIQSTRKSGRDLSVLMIVLISLYSYFVLYKRVKADYRVFREKSRSEILAFFFPDHHYLYQVKKRMGAEEEICLFNRQQRFLSKKIDQACWLMLPKKLNHWAPREDSPHRLILENDEFRYFHGHDEILLLKSGKDQVK